MQETAAPTLSNVVPSTLPEAGGGVLTMTGTNFVASRLMRCSFSNSRVAPATYVTASTALCVAPGSAAGSVTVSITSNRVNYSPTRTLTYVGTHVLL
jgi:hypothetical protein